MRVLLTALLGAASLAGAATPSAAQTTGDKADARCILVLTLAARDPKNKEAANSGSFYFLGRLNAHGMSAKLGPMMIAETKTITSPAQVQSELTRCGAELNARGAEIRTALAQLQQAGKAAAAARPQPPAK